MAKYRVQFNLVEYHQGGGKNTMIDSVTVTAENEVTAIMLATNKVKIKSLARGREILVNSVRKMQ